MSTPLIFYSTVCVVLCMIVICVTVFMQLMAAEQQ